MKRLSKYIFAVLLIGIIFIPASAMAADFTWLEAENGTVVSGAYEPVSEEQASGGGGMFLYTPDEETAQVDFTFSVSKAGEYDVKILTTAGDVDYLSNFSWSIDGGNYTACSRLKSKSVYNYGTLNQAVMWYSLGKTTLGTGSHTFSVKTDYKRFDDDFMYHYFDVVAIVPSTWEWTPNGIEQPVKVKEARDTGLWINIGPNTNINQEGAYIVDGVSAAVQGPKPEGTVYEFPVTFKVPQEGEYDVYFCGSPNNADYATPARYFLDGVDKGMLSASKSYKNIYSGMVAGDGCGMVWERIENLTLDTEEHTITFKYDSTRAMDDWYVFVLRYLVFVPSGTQIDLTDLSRAQAAGEIAKSAITLDCDYDNVQDDLALPKKTINGANISWSSSNPEIINKNGIVNLSNEDKQVTLTAEFTIENELGDTAKITKEFSLTVKKIGEYAVRNFALTYSDGSDVNELRSGETLIASADIIKGSADAGEAVMIVAVYNRDNAMVAVNSVKTELSDIAQNVKVSLPLEGDVSGYTAQAFIWNGMKLHKLMVSPIFIGGGNQ